MQFTMLEGYAMPRRARKGRKMKATKKRGGRSNSRFAQVARSCAREGHKPGTKAFGSCVRQGMKK